MQRKRRISWASASTGFAAILWLSLSIPVLSGQTGPGPQRDFTKELANKTIGTYVVSTVGGVLMQEPFATQLGADIKKALADADTTVGQLEFYQVDSRTWPGSWSNREIAQGIADVGFNLVGIGEADGGQNAMQSSVETLGTLGIRVAMPNRQPVFQSLPQGRVALLTGPNPVRGSTTKFVTAEQMRQLKAIRDSIVARRHDPDVSRPIALPADLPNQVTIFGDTFVEGPVAGEVRFEIVPAERQSNVMSVRNSKEYADFSIFSMPLMASAQHYSQEHKPAQALVDLAHEMVDNGMDMFVGHGGHTIQGIEIYKGRPIFYSTGDVAAHRSVRGVMSENLHAFIGSSKYQDGILQEVRIYPIDVGSDASLRPASKLGVPMIPPADLAARILADVQRYSEPFGTKIAIENGVGIIRVPKEATVAIGQNIRDFGPPAGAAGAGGGRGGRGGGRGGP